MDSKYCDRIGELMDKAQAWCLDIEELYSKAEVHSINTSVSRSKDGQDLNRESISKNQIRCFQYLLMSYISQSFQIMRLVS